MLPRLPATAVWTIAPINCGLSADEIEVVSQGLWSFAGMQMTGRRVDQLVGRERFEPSPKSIRPLKRSIVGTVLPLTPGVPYRECAHGLRTLTQYID